MSSDPNGNKQQTCGEAIRFQYNGCMSRLNAILETHRDAIVNAAHRHNATAIALVGSTARGGDTETSDCDFLADFAPETTYFDLSNLATEIESLLGCKVDIIPTEGLKPHKHIRILEDAIPL